MDISRIPVYDVVFDEEAEGLVFQSHVSEPAIGYDWITLSKEYPNIKLLDEERMIVAGPLLVPDQKVIRYEGATPYYIRFKSEEIDKFHQDFMKNRRLDRVADYQHTGKLIPAFVLEMWRVEDPEKDKSNLWGYNLPVGTLFAVHKVTSREYWEKEIKSGNVKGFSVDIQAPLVAALDNQNTQTMKKLKMNEQKFARTAEGALLVNQDGNEILSVGDQVFIVAEDGTQTPAPEGEHVLETGETIVIVEGAIAEIRPAAEMEAEEAKLEVTPEEQTAIVSEVMQILEPRFAQMEETLKALMEFIDLNKEKMKAQGEELEKAKAEIQKLNSQKPGGVSLKKAVPEAPKTARKTIYDDLDSGTAKLITQLTK